jgi:hypothetical protein
MERAHGMTALVPAGISSSPVRLAYLTSVGATGRSRLLSATGYGLMPKCTILAKDEKFHFYG